MSANSSYERGLRMASELKETSFVAQKPSRILGGPISVLSTCESGCFLLYMTWSERYSTRKPQNLPAPAPAPAPAPQPTDSCHYTSFKPLRWPRHPARPSCTLPLLWSGPLSHNCTRRHSHTSAQEDAHISWKSPIQFHVLCVLSITTRNCVPVVALPVSVHVFAWPPLLS